MDIRKGNRKYIWIAAIVAILLIASVGVVTYTVSLSHRNSMPQELRSASSEQVDTDTMMSKVKMKMPRSEVEAAIGKPYECAKTAPSTMGGKTYVMEHCRFGDKTAAKYLNVTYIEDAVWGVTIAMNTAR